MGARYPDRFPGCDGVGDEAVGVDEVEGLGEGVGVFNSDRGAGGHGGEHGVRGVAEDEHFLGWGGPDGKLGDVLDRPFEGCLDEFEDFYKSVIDYKSAISSRSFTSYSRRVPSFVE